MPIPEELAQQRTAQAKQRFDQDFSGALQLGCDAATFRRILWHLLDSPEWCGTHGLATVDSANKVITEPLIVYMRQGRQSIGVEMEATIKRLSPPAYMKMLNEAMGIRNNQPGKPIETGPAQ